MLRSKLVWEDVSNGLTRNLDIILILKYSDDIIMILRHYNDIVILQTEPELAAVTLGTYMETIIVLVFAYFGAYKAGQ